MDTSLCPTILHSDDHSQPAIALWLIFTYLTCFLAHTCDQCTLILTWEPTEAELKAGFTLHQLFKNKGCPTSVKVTWAFSGGNSS